MTEIWTSTTNNTLAEIRPKVERFEAAGFDGCCMSDSQNIRMECWVALTVAAMSSRRLALGTHVTNPLTRHVAVTAGAAATLQEVTGGRFVLGVGRGDSALANIGYGPVPMARFERFLIAVQHYLRGEAVPFDFNLGADLVRAADLGYQQTPDESRIVWLPSDQPKVPVNVVASGKKTLQMGARYADEVTLVHGANLDVLTAGMRELRDARVAAGLDPSTLRINAMIPVVVEADQELARQRARMTLGEVGRWMSLQHGQPEYLDSNAREDFSATVGGYVMARHGPSGSLATPAVTTQMSADVIDRHAITGPPEVVLERLRPILALGFHRILLPPDNLLVKELLSEILKIAAQSTPASASKAPESH